MHSSYQDFHFDIHFLGEVDQQISLSLTTRASLTLQQVKRPKSSAWPLQRSVDCLTDMHNHYWQWQLQTKIYHLGQFCTAELASPLSHLPTHFSLVVCSLNNGKLPEWPNLEKGLHQSRISLDGIRCSQTTDISTACSQINNLDLNQITTQLIYSQFWPRCGTTSLTKAVCIVVLDIKGALDQVWHNSVCVKLTSKGITWRLHISLLNTSKRDPSEFISFQVKVPSILTRTLMMFNNVGTCFSTQMIPSSHP